MKITRMVIIILIIALAVNACIAAVFVARKDNSHNIELNRIKHLINEYEEANGVAADDLSALLLFASEKGSGQKDFIYIRELSYTEADGLYDVKAPEGDADVIKFINSVPEDAGNVAMYYATDRYLYRIIYKRSDEKSVKNTRIMLFVAVNTVILIAAVTCIIMHIYYQNRIIKPLRRMTGIPAEIAKGNLTNELPELKGKAFGDFNWGMNMLRDKLEETKAKNLQLERDKKVLLMSLSHDIKTPLSTISLYSKAISKGLYKGDKLTSSAESIQEKVLEIEGYMKRIVNASNEDIIEFEVNNRDVYLKEIVDCISEYYSDKMKLKNIRFEIGKYDNRFINADPERLIEVLQNVIENAVKYGDGKRIWIDFGEETVRSGVTITINNTGCTLEKRELANIFESFYRGTNTGRQEGSGLGLYICRRLMRMMNGDIYADISEDPELGSVMSVRMEI